MHEAAMIAARLRRFPVLIVVVEREKKKKTKYCLTGLALCVTFSLGSPFFILL